MRKKKDRQDFIVHQQCPEVNEQVSLIHLSLPVKNHIFWCDLSCMAWAPLLSHRDSMPPEDHSFVDPAPRQKYNYATFSTSKNQHCLKN